MMGSALQSEAALRRPDEYDSPDDASGTKQWIVQIGTTLWDYLTGYCQSWWMGHSFV